MMTDLGSTNKPLPERLTLAEDGMWETPSWAHTNDDDEWRSFGWKAVTYAGNVYYWHKEESNVRAWLTSRGYVDTGDGKHWSRDSKQDETA